MPSRQDQVYRYASARLAAALVARDSEPRVPATGRAALASVLVAVIAVGVVAAWSRLTADDAGWREPDVVVMERESGARYVWHGGTLHPVANYTSAQLILGAPAPRVVPVPRTALDRVPRGAPLGIPGVPDRLPPAGRLLTGAWTVCSTVGGDGAPRAVLLVGAEPEGGVALADRGLLVQDPDGVSHLIWRQRRYRLPDRGPGPADRSPVVAAALLDALPEGGTAAAPPELVTPAAGGAVCAVVPDLAGPAMILLDVRLTPPTGGAPAGVVVVAPGHGSAVSAGGDVSVVSDLGVRHPAGPLALKSLGYGEVVPVRMPGALVALVPVGAALDPVRARTPGGQAHTGYP
jgi:hypothetical protein